MTRQGQMQELQRLIDVALEEAKRMEGTPREIIDRLREASQAASQALAESSRGETPEG